MLLKPCKLHVHQYELVKSSCYFCDVLYFISINSILSILIDAERTIDLHEISHNLEMVELEKPHTKEEERQKRQLKDDHKSMDEIAATSKQEEAANLINHTTIWGEIKARRRRGLTSKGNKFLAAYIN